MHVISHYTRKLYNLPSDSPIKNHKFYSLFCLFQDAKKDVIRIPFAYEGKLITKMYDLSSEDIWDYDHKRLGSLNNQKFEKWFERTFPDFLNTN